MIAKVAVDQLLNGKQYRKCSWVKDGLNNSDCAQCGAVLLPKNEYGYARTNPELFDKESIDMATDNSKSANKK